MLLNTAILEPAHLSPSISFTREMGGKKLCHLCNYSIWHEPFAGGQGQSLIYGDQPANEISATNSATCLSHGKQVPNCSSL